MGQYKEHKIREIVAGSIGEELGLAPGDSVLAINSQRIEDIFDYQYMIQEEYLELLVRKQDGEEWLLEIEKEYEEDLGILFENGLMDEYRHCQNKCIFCFIDQMPKGMRETLYFKDDDSRLSFLQGNYVTLTNMTDQDVERICKYRLSPINISFQTMEPELRCKMLNNRFAGEALKKAERFREADIEMNGQIVLCKGVNDKEHLQFSLRELMRYMPQLKSVSVVPVGLSKYRDGLYPLEAFTQEEAAETLSIIHAFQKECYEKYGTHFVHASDEWYFLAKHPLPEEETYDGYPQLENGVGMTRLLLEEFAEELNRRKQEDNLPDRTVCRFLSMATGKLAYPFICRLAKDAMEAYPNLHIQVYEITNFFFGEQITVSGLITGRDLQEQLTGKDLGERLLLPQNMLRSGEDVFLDDYHVGDLERALQVPIDIVKSSGRDLLAAMTGK